MKATLIARASRDGLVELHDHIPLGKLYELGDGPYDVAVIIGRHIETGTVWARPMFLPSATEGWLPCECFDFTP